MPMLEAREISATYSTDRGPLKAVRKVSFNLNPGEALGVVGESGCGKSSLALSLIRMLPGNAFFEGTLELAGERIDLLSEEEFRFRIRWSRIALVFQGAQNSLNPVVRVGLQVTEPLLAKRSIAKDEAERKARRLLGMVGLPEESFLRYPHELSGGMKQRVVIAMSLISDPQILILDEPTSALDVSVQARIINLLKRLRKELSLSMIFITHDIALASDICDRMAVMYAGSFVEVAPSESLLTDPKHPYTQKLLASIPRLRGGRPEFIPGAPADLVDPPRGCRFHPRCPKVFERCRIEEPPDIMTGENRQAKCWLYGE